MNPIIVGSGPDSADLWINHLDGPGVLFEVHFIDDGSFTGIDLLQTVTDAAIGFNFHNDGGFITEISYDGLSDEGEGLFPPFQDYWHYWTDGNQSSGDWFFSNVGAGGRLIHDGHSDGWFFGFNDTLPQVSIPGDANRDGTVSFADFVILQSHFGQSGLEVHWADGDFNGDNQVSFADFVILQSHFGQEQSLVPRGLDLPKLLLSVPSPTSAVVLISGLVVGLLARNR